MAVPTASVSRACLRPFVIIMLERAGFFAFQALEGAMLFVNLWIKNISEQNFTFLYQVQLYSNIVWFLLIFGLICFDYGYPFFCKFCSSTYILTWPFSLLLAEKLVEGRLNWWMMNRNSMGCSFLNLNGGFVRTNQLLYTLPPSFPCCTHGWNKLENPLTFLS